MANTELERLAEECRKKREEMRQAYKKLPKVTFTKIIGTDPADVLVGAVVRFGLQTIAPGFLKNLKRMGLDPGKWAGKV
jgi:hypothetical protein